MKKLLFQCRQSNISHGSVASPLRCGGMFSDCFIANFVQSLRVKEFLKSDNACWMYAMDRSTVSPIFD